MNPLKRTGRLLMRFARAQDGVITVEWVALAGAVVIGGIAVAWAVLNTLPSHAGTTGAAISACEHYAAAHHGSTTGCT